MEKKSDSKKGKALFIAGNLILSILAFSFLIALESGGVRGQVAVPGADYGVTPTPAELAAIQNSQKYTAAQLGTPTTNTNGLADSLGIGGVPRVTSPVVNSMAPPPAMNLPPAAGKLGLPGVAPTANTPLLTEFNTKFAQGIGTETKDIYNPILGNIKGAGVLNTDTGSWAKTADGSIFKYDPAAKVWNPVEGAAAKAIASTPQAQQAWLPAQLGLESGSGLSALVGALQWAAIAGVAGYLIGTLFGMSKNNTMALAMAFAGGAGVASFMIQDQAIVTALGHDYMLWSGVAGIGVAAVIFLMMYKKTSTQLVTFTCKPYEPPIGGQYCELCNRDKLRPCSEYRCKSLGQACDIVNAGTAQEQCVWKNPKDVKSPGVKKLDSALLKGYTYTNYIERPEGGSGTPGRYTITRTGASDGCVKAFTPLTFGINTTEPSQCKIDLNSSINVRDAKAAYASMGYFFGDSNLYTYEHTETLSLPGPAALAAQNVSLEISNDGSYTYYVRCQDANGNIMEDEFAIKFCVEKGPDTTPPVIEGTSIANNMPVSFNTNDTALEVYVNEPADCRWSKTDTDYDSMEHQMACDQNVWDINTNMVYKCATTLTGLENRQDNDFYFRCKDQPYAAKDSDRNKNTESYKFTIKGSQPLNIKANSIAPNGTVEGFADVVSADLTLETENGYNKGDAICYYSTSNLDSSYVKMFETGTNKHLQNQQLAAGTYAYYFKCIDLGGNADFGNTTFTIAVDRSAPQIVRVYNEGGNLKLDTDEPSTCYYSDNSNLKCNYQLTDGTQMKYTNVSEHYIDWNTQKNLYIKCADMNGNQPNPTDCSIIVKPYNEQITTT